MRQYHPKGKAYGVRKPPFWEWLLLIVGILLAIFGGPVGIVIGIIFAFIWYRRNTHTE